MNHLKRIVLILALALCSGGIGFSAWDAAILLEEAIYIEETLGDFDEAARIYQQIADNAESGRPAAAQALYRLGMGYEKRERKEEAMKTFVRLVIRYPEQEELISRIPARINTNVIYTRTDASGAEERVVIGIANTTGTVSGDAKVARVTIQSGALRGTITDASGAVLHGATVFVTNLGSGVATKAITNPSGVYIFPSLQPGTYEIAVEAAGFVRATRTNISLNPGSDISLDIPMEYQK